MLENTAKIYNMTKVVHGEKMKKKKQTNNTALTVQLHNIKLFDYGNFKDMAASRAA